MQENFHKGKVLFSLLHTTGHITLTSLTANVAFDRLVKVVSAKLLPVKFLLSLTIHTLVYPINLVYSNNCCATLMVFSISFIPCTLIIWNSSVRKTCPFILICLFKYYLYQYGLKGTYLILWVII